MPARAAVHVTNSPETDSLSTYFLEAVLRGHPLSPVWCDPTRSPGFIHPRARSLSGRRCPNAEGDGLRPSRWLRTTRCFPPSPQQPRWPALLGKVATSTQGVMLPRVLGKDSRLRCHESRQPRSGCAASHQKASRLGQFTLARPPASSFGCDT